MKKEPTQKQLRAMHYGCFDGLRGLEIRMTLDDALSASHQGKCDDDVSAIVRKPTIAKQLDAISPDTLREGLKEAGAWDTDELSDDAQNRQRALWMAACDIRENWNQPTE